MFNSQLKLFTDPTVLRHVNRNLLAEFFGRFTHLLPKYGLPNPISDFYPDILAEVLLQLDQFPAPFVQALLAVEEMAAPEKHPPLGPETNNPEAVRLAEAIRLWLHPPVTEAPPSDILHSGLSTPHSDALPTPHSGAPSAAHSDHDEFLRLARLSITEYDRVRRAEAKRLDLRVRTLDTQVARCRTQFSNDAEANAVKLPILEPWPEPVDGAEVLTQVLARFNLYLALCPGTDVALTLWGGHTHVYKAFHQTPRLNLHSPEGGCGKSTTLEILATMTPRPLSTENMKPAVLFRVVDQQQPTLLLDELDTYLYQANELRGLLNAGHKRGACAYRCEGAGNSIRAFNAFAPAALAGIGPLPATLRDRSILIPLLKAQPGQIVARFDSHNSQTENILGRKLARWAKDNFDALAACNPTMPPGAFNRLADNWRPLFAIAQVAGGDWPQRAAEAFALLTPKPHADPDLDLTLLADIRSIFAASGAQRLFSTTLVHSLAALPSRTGSTTSGNHSPLNQTSLACRLRAFNVVSHNVRIGDIQAKGYDLADFAEPFALFLDSQPPNA